jgi:thiol:disulfide interchange protein DsbC
MNMPCARPVILFLLAVGLAQADPAIDAIRNQLAKVYPDARAGEITPSPVPGLFEMRLGPQVVYVSGDGRYLIRGDIFDTRENRNLTEDRQNAARLAAVNAVGEDHMVIFTPKQVKHTVTVFTDMDCGYCRKLHRQLDEYLAQGIRIRYVFFPRSGPNTDSWFKAEQVWCSADRNDALTRAKRGEMLRSAKCSPNPVLQHYTLGRQFGIEGTPAIVTDTGELIPGYESPTELVDILSHRQAG